MQLVGIGFSSHDWEKIIEQLQKHFSPHVNTKLYEVTNSVSETKLWLKDAENLSADILNYNPDWLLFSPGKFESPQSYLNMLDKLQHKSVKRVSLVMVIKSIQEELHSILTFNPTFELINKMRFKISAPELLLNHHIPKFPRIPLNSQFQTIEYVSDSGSLVKHTPDQIPLNTLIPFKNIRQIQTKKSQLSPGESIKMILRENSKISDPKQVVGILREAKSCYLFPGIPLNSIKNITIDKTRIEHLIRLDECNEDNPSFKRFVKGLNKENAEKPKKKIAKTLQSGPQILCLCRYSIISIIIKKLLKGIGYANAVAVEDISPEDSNLKDAEILLKLHDCNVYNFKGQILDWRKELDHILEPLSQFVFLNDIKLAVKTGPLSFQHDDFDGLKEKLLEKEKAALKMNMYAESDELIYLQEYDVLKKIEPLATLLNDALSTSTNWESADKDFSQITIQKALLLCEDENDASEMNFKLNKVQRKLWLNPFSIKKPEDLTQLKSKIIRSYLSPGSLVIKPTALKHLKKICLQTKQECKTAKKTLKKQKELLKKTKSELKMVQINKNKLALSWLETNLKELLFRDLQLLDIDSGIVE